MDPFQFFFPCIGIIIFNDNRSVKTGSVDHIRYFDNVFFNDFQIRHILFFVFAPCLGCRLCIFKIIIDDLLNQCSVAHRHPFVRRHLRKAVHIIGALLIQTHLNFFHIRNFSGDRFLVQQIAHRGSTVFRCRDHAIISLILGIFRDRSGSLSILFYDSRILPLRFRHIISDKFGRRLRFPLGLCRTSFYPSVSGKTVLFRIRHAHHIITFGSVHLFPAEHRYSVLVDRKRDLWRPVHFKINGKHGDDRLFQLFSGLQIHILHHVILREVSPIVEFSFVKQGSICRLIPRIFLAQSLAHDPADTPPRRSDLQLFCLLIPFKMRSDGLRQFRIFEHIYDLRVFSKFRIHNVESHLQFQMFIARHIFDRLCIHIILFVFLPDGIRQLCRLHRRLLFFSVPIRLLFRLSLSLTCRQQKGRCQ